MDIEYTKVDKALKFRNPKAANMKYGTLRLFIFIQYKTGKQNQFLKEFGYSIRRKEGETAYTVHFGQVIKKNIHPFPIIDQQSKLRRLDISGIEDNLEDIKQYILKAFRGVASASDIKISFILGGWTEE